MGPPHAPRLRRSYCTTTHDTPPPLPPTFFLVHHTIIVVLLSTSSEYNAVYFSLRTIAVMSVSGFQSVSRTYFCKHLGEVPSDDRATEAPIAETFFKLLLFLSVVLPKTHQPALIATHFFKIAWRYAHALKQVDH